MLFHSSKESSTRFTRLSSISDWSNEARGARKMIAFTEMIYSQSLRPLVEQPTSRGGQSTNHRRRSFPKQISGSVSHRHHKCTNLDHVLDRVQD